MVEEVFGIKTDNKELFKCALTHPSYTKENDLSFCECYERLEFLGDSVLKLSVSDILYKKYPEYNEGQLSKIRSIVVSDNTLSKIAKEIGLDKLIILAKHDEKQGLRKLESVTACAFEAVLGAYYLDGKFEKLLIFIGKTFNKYIEDVDSNFEKFNAKALLQEYTQGLTKETPVYKVIAQTGPAHNREFTVEVSYKGEVVSQGIGASKKEAEQHAAYEACQKLGVNGCQK